MRWAFLRGRDLWSRPSRPSGLILKRSPWHSLQVGGIPLALAGHWQGPKIHSAGMHRFICLFWLKLSLAPKPILSSERRTLGSVPSLPSVPSVPHESHASPSCEDFRSNIENGILRVWILKLRLVFSLSPFFSFRGPSKFICQDAIGFTVMPQCRNFKASCQEMCSAKVPLSSDAMGTCPGFATCNCDLQLLHRQQRSKCLLHLPMRKNSLEHSQCVKYKRIYTESLSWGCES